ncbi:DUF3592 domain-containing protein [Sessilibacter corallicola]|uniref:DUF3592 domain-containing protein n=1 Tax=Sessilibacter corallicola TaxID=2904075 RepID=A0ABQ0AE40_9GAMM
MELGVLFKLLMLFVWFCIVALSARNFFRGRASVNWPTTVASVSSSEILEKNDGNGLTFYSPIIKYQYFVNDAVYQGATFTFMGTFGITRYHAEKYISMYPSGSKFNVYYNPKSPDISVIIPGVHWGQYLSVAVITLVFFSLAHIVEILSLF